MNINEHKCAPAVSAQPPATFRHAARLGAQQGRRQRQQAGSCRPAGTSLCVPFPHLQSGTESPDKCLDHPKNNRSTTSMFPEFPPFIASMQVLHAKANEGREPGSTSVPPGSTTLGWSWTFTSSLYMGFVPSSTDTNPKELQSLHS